MTNDKGSDEKQAKEEEKVEDKKQSKENKESDELRKKIAECEDIYKRALADYQNLQRRVQEEKAHWIRNANKDLLLKLLPVLDTLNLASKHINDQGLTLSIQQFLDVLEKEGVKKIETVGKSFDPHTMECVETVVGREGKVLEEIRSGYMLYDTVLRAAQVTVGKAHVDQQEEEKAKKELEKGDYM